MTETTIAVTTTLTEIVAPVDRVGDGTVGGGSQISELCSQLEGQH